MATNYARHDWHAPVGKRVPVDWCRFCGALRFHRLTGFWGRTKLQYVTPWNHSNGDKNKTVLEIEPHCVELP